MVHLHSRQIRFVYQGYRVKVKVTGVKVVYVCRKHLQSEAGEFRQSLSYVHNVV